MAIQSYVMSGIEKIEFAPAYTTEAGAPAANAWRRVENIAPGSVTYNNNEDNKTPITPEDKDAPVVVLKAPGDPDSFDFSVLDFSPENFADLFNVAYDAATTKITMLAQRKESALAIRVTTRPVGGTKRIYVFPNTTTTATVQNSFTKDGLVQIGASADILSFTTTAGQEALYTHQIVNPDGTTINSTPAG